MKAKQDKLVERPLRRKWIKESGPAWVVLAPSRVAPVGGFFFTALALTFYIAKQALGYETDFLRMVFGTVFTFVLSYAATGLFVWFLLIVGEREFPILEKEHGRRGLGSSRDKVDKVTIESVVDEAVIEAMEPPVEEH